MSIKSITRLPSRLLIVLASALVVSCSDAPESSTTSAEPTAAEILEHALAAIGGREAIGGLKRYAIQGTRAAFMMGQGPLPGRGLFGRAPAGMAIAHDLERRELRVEATQRFAARAGGYDTRIATELITAGAGYAMAEDRMGIVASNNNPLSPERVVAALKNERLLNPHLILQELLVDPSRVSVANAAPETAGKLRFTTEQAMPVTLDRVRQTGRRTLIATQEWLTATEGSNFFELMAEKVEVNDGWLDSWHAVTELTGPHQRLVIEDEVYPITLHIDPDTGRIDKLSTMEWDVVYGDVSLEVNYDDWKDFGGVWFPTQVRMSIAGAPRMNVTRSQVFINPAFAPGTFDPPEGVTYTHDEARAQRGRRLSQSLSGFGFAGVGRPEIAGIEIVPGVTLVYAAPLDGVYTLIVEQANGLVLMEPGQNDLKGEAIIEWARQNHPDKPITHLIVSHHHNDHAGGIRPYVAAGATIVAHEAAAEFFATQAARPKSTIEIDALDRNPVLINIAAVVAGEVYRIDDELRPVAVYPLEMGHTADMVFAVIEPEKILYAGDLYVSGLARDLRAGRKRGPDILPFHSAVALARGIEAYELDVPMLLGSHDRQPVAYTDLLEYITND